MTIMMREAQLIFSSRDASERAKLNGLRLRMAGALTSLQLSLDAEIHVLRSEGTGSVTGLVELADRWATTATEFRTFAGMAGSAAAPAWPEYVVMARAFVRRFTLLNAETARALRALRASTKPPQPQPTIAARGVS